MLFNEDQLAISDLARRFAREKLAPQYQKLDGTGVLDRAVIGEMGELGLMGVDLPESSGGSGRRALRRALSQRNSHTATSTSAPCPLVFRCSARSS